MAKKTEIPISNLSVKRAIKLTLLFFVKYRRWKDIKHYVKQPSQIATELEELIEKDFLAPKGKGFSLTKKGLNSIELLGKSIRQTEFIFYNFVSATENSKKSKKEVMKNGC